MITVQTVRTEFVNIRRSSFSKTVRILVFTKIYNLSTTINTWKRYHVYQVYTGCPRTYNINISPVETLPRVQCKRVHVDTCSVHNGPQMPFGGTHSQNVRLAGAARMTNKVKCQRSNLGLVLYLIGLGVR